MSATVEGRIHWSADYDQEGHREYTLKLHVITDDVEDGPHAVSNAGGMPSIGTGWIYGNDNDPWAFCYPNLKLTPLIERERNNHWIAELFFSTRPLKRCADTPIENPLDEPHKEGGTFLKYVKECRRDRFGVPILSSSWEPLLGIEKDANRPTVWIEQNVSGLELDVFSEMVDTVNDSFLWGLDERKIKMDEPTWERKMYGTCNFYYTRRFNFSINWDTWDDIDVADAGFKVFRYGSQVPGTGTGSGTGTGAGEQNRNDPTDYVLYKDALGENSPQKILLDGNGNALTDPNNPVFLNPIEKYNESNFLLLGIPSSL